MFKLIIKHSTQLYIGWFFFIALLTLLPGSVVPNISWDFISIDKTVHIIMFTVLVFIALVSTTYGNLKIYGKLPKLMSILTAMLYGYVLELMQSFIPQRSYDFADFTADCVGTLVGYGLFLGVLNILPNNK